MKVSCVMCTYRRMKYVERAVSFFLDQDYKGETELIIYNTNEDYPVTMIDQPSNISIINNGIDRITGSQYTNIGAIRRDASLTLQATVTSHLMTMTGMPPGLSEKE